MSWNVWKENRRQKENQNIDVSVDRPNMIYSERKCEERDAYAPERTKIEGSTWFL